MAYFLIDNKLRPPLGLKVDLPEILADNPKGDQLHTTQHKD